jgi:hypothetical protein
MGGDRSRWPPVLTHFAWSLAGLAALSLVYTLVMTRLLGTAHPYGVTLFTGRFVGTDFTVFAERSRHFGTAAYWDELNYPFTYPAPLGVVFALLFRVPHPLACYLALCGAALAGWGWGLAAGLAAAGCSRLQAAAFAAVILAFSWPVVLLFDTGNIEGLLAIVLAAGVWALLRRHWMLGATLVGLAASMKLFPFILLALLLSRRRYKEFAWGVAVAAAATGVSLALQGPNLLEAQRHIAAGIRFVKYAFIFSTRPDALNYSHSLFSPLKFVVVLAVCRLGRAACTFPQETSLLEAAYRVYLAAAAIGGVALYFLRIRFLPTLNQLLALTVCAVLLPPLSADYTLLELLLPFALLCIYAAEQQPRGLPAAFACFTILFAWETFLTIRFSFDRPIRAAALVLLLVVVLRFPWPWPKLDDPAQPSTRIEATL